MWKIMMEKLLGNSQGFLEGKGSIASNLRMHRFWLQSLLLILLASVTSASNAGAIHDAARSGDLEQIQRLIVKGTDVNEYSNQNETPLIIASLAGQGEIVGYLLQRGADIDARNTTGLTALHAAAYAGHADIVTLLVVRGAAVNDAENLFGVTPLHLASEENHIETVQNLLVHDADIAAFEGNGYSAMSRAGWREHWDIVKALLAKGETCQRADKVGEWLYQECSKRKGVN